jgi:hypothetical protein
VVFPGFSNKTDHHDITDITDITDVTDITEILNTITPPTLHLKTNFKSEAVLVV